MGYYKRPLTTETRFQDLSLHPTVATALSRKGYELAMPVQAAVLAPEAADRDLLVSSQTGSGKTIAFGLVFAPAVLEGRPPVSAKGVLQPRVLVVAPTRELATQVSQELGWLFGDAPVRLASFTGGTPITSDFRRLRAGVDVVVGTPGRLVDLQTRGALDLSAIKVLVLDEADEMLDMGFKEDLEALLTAAPPERRTLMFSATIAGPIARLAATYQNKAFRVDVRPAGGTRAHADINFVAHLVPMRDRFAVLANTLLANPDSKAIVFCRTREGVGELQHKLVAHGFAAVAMAGDRAQGERDRALAALRSGAARVLVATNVAARGLDVPDVEFVVHGDLPEGTESLTHRSGRTGRAGRKGTSIVLADPPKRRRAERLFADAGIKVRWSAPTTQAQAQRAAEDQLAQRLMERLSGVAPEDDEAPVDPQLAQNAEALAERLLASVDEKALVKVLLERELRKLPAALPIEVLSVDPPARSKPRHLDFDSGAPPARMPRRIEREEPRPALRPPISSPKASRAPEAPTAKATPRARVQAPEETFVPITARAAVPSEDPDRPLRAARKAKPDAKSKPETLAPSKPALPRAMGREQAQDFKASAAKATGPKSAGLQGRAVIFRVNLGAKEQAEPRTLLPMICRMGGVDRTAVGSIRVGPASSTFEIAPSAAVAFARAVMKPDPHEPHVRIEAARAPEGDDTRRTGGGGLPPKRAKPGARAEAY